MMTSGVSMGNNWFFQLNQAGSANQSSGAGNSNGVSGGNASNAADPMSAAGGRLLQAISAALSQIGVGSNQTSSASTTGDPSSSSTQDPTQALAAFMQDLMAALQSQGSAQGIGTDSDGDNDGSGSVHAGGKHHHPNIQADLQRLIQQVSASDGSSSSTSTTTSTTGSSSDTLSSLEQSFQNLLDSLGGSGGTASLGDFLQAFADNMQNASAVGNVVKAQA